MAAWITYLNQRFSLPSYVLLVSGLAFSGSYLGDGRFSPVAFGVSFIGIFIFFALLRLMDEVKDYDIDKVAHPQRPLPKGLLQLEQVKKVILRTILLMLVYALIVALVVNWQAGTCYLLITFYLWLMYREFGVSDWLSTRPVYYALSHQFILVFICYFTTLLVSPHLFKVSLPLYYSLMMVGAFFSYEVCRKLDPNAHPLLKTYISVHGASRTAVLVVVANLIAMTGALGLELGRYIIPIEGIVIASLVLIWLRPHAYKVVEGVATLSLVMHIWIVPLSYWLI